MMVNDSYVEFHYQKLLAPNYTWMRGGYAQGIDLARTYFKELGVHVGTGSALDLGCGPGIEAVALAELGYHVTAVDFSEELLDELRMYQLNQRTQFHQQIQVTTRQVDLTKLEQETFVSKFDLVVCLGDTITHLPAWDDVKKLFNVVSQLQTLQGQFILSFRDLSTELSGTDRIIPVRTESDKIMLTFLEYFPDHVHVHDTILVKKEHTWEMIKSWYPKLRLSTAMIVQQLQELKFEITQQSVMRGLTTLVAKKLG